MGYLNNVYKLTSFTLKDIIDIKNGDETIKSLKPNNFMTSLKCLL
jgi:hypothetical protein